MRYLTIFVVLATAAISMTAQSDCTLQYDGDGNGIVNSIDVIGLLSEFGSLCFDSTTIDTVGFPSCGGPIPFQGYDYATVLIGEQCWFAENLRSENYRNGDAIPVNITNYEWAPTTSGATAVYGQTACAHSSPDINACDPAESLNEYGRLYNWYAVEDARGLCPSGWHVPTDEEWTEMTDFLGEPCVEAGVQMKTTYGWANGLNGTNSSGFSGLPGGYLSSSDSDSNGAGLVGRFWSSSSDGPNAWLRQITHFFDTVTRMSDDLQGGFSVRCVRDAE